MILKPIPGFSDYFAGEDGNIYSMKCWGTNGKNKVSPPATPRKMKEKVSKLGYREVYPFVGGKHRYTKISFLVCSAFYGPRPPGMWVCHGPLGRLNDTPSNLYWGTPSRNMRDDKRRDGTSNRGERNHSARLNSRQVKRIKKMLGEWTISDIALLFNVSDSCIAHISARHSWGWLE